MNAKTIEQIERDLDGQTVGYVMGRPVTRAQLSAAFDLVRPRDNWKFPIDAVVDLDDGGLAMTHEAVVFYTGSIPRFEPRHGAELPKCRYRVCAAGYYRTIGA